ncbi:MAG: 30S ribosomal protein S6e [Candidatus Heimdallarchaeota archaeon]|nr:30S ribosomal protein S6e [Candidatus Heimdallarchaeota archaeon]
MVRFQLNIADGKQSYKKEIDADAMTRQLIGKSLGDELEGEVIGFDGYHFRITGGSDHAGFPMAPGIEGAMPKRILIGHRGVGYKPTRAGKRRRKRVRGAMISEDIYQINLKILKRENKAKSIEELL